MSRVRAIARKDKSIAKNIKASLISIEKSRFCAIWEEVYVEGV